MHWIILHLVLLIQTHVGTARYCGFNFQTRQWECNYDTAQECLTYNEFCRELGE